MQTTVEQREIEKEHSPNVLQAWNVIQLTFQLTPDNKIQTLRADEMLVLFVQW